HRGGKSSSGCGIRFDTPSRGEALPRGASTLTNKNAYRAQKKIGLSLLLIYYYRFTLYIPGHFCSLMIRVRLALISVFLSTSAFGQLTERNPVDELKEHVTKALAEANVPLSPDQEKQLALLVEEERQAAENLFGITWDFSKGPPQGEQRDQALAGIQW